MSSIWSQTAQRTPVPPLREDLKTDVLIIGGGLAGLLCAYRLTQAGVNCTLVEADTLCSGVSQNTTAKLTAQHGLIYQRLVHTFGADAARLYYEANSAALQQYFTLCKAIDCDFEEKDTFVYSRTDRAPLEAELAALEAMGVPARFQEKLPLPFPTVGAVKFTRQAQFHPLKFAYAIAQGLKIYENTPVRQFTPRGILTDTNVISADQTIVCTHFPLLNKHGSYFLKLYQERSYVLALAEGPDLGGMYLDQQTGGLSLRNYRNYLLLGGENHRTGKPGEAWAGLAAQARRYYPGKREAARWATQDCMTLDGVPYIGRYSARTRGLYVATGFNKWGMTSSMVAAHILTDLVLGRENPYVQVFSPSRTMLRPQLAVNGMEAAMDLLSFSPRRCPHMGCALKWNRQERTWDCPCHGSRFAEDGSLLDNPATGGLE